LTPYRLDSRGRDKAALVALDMTTRQSRVLAQDPNADLTQVIFKGTTGGPLAAGGMFDRQRWHAVDPSGLRIHGYLTLPAAGAENVPMVLVIHGGPYFRDRWGFDPTHQWLANRGYAVLSVNYRGSTGFGKAFVTAAVDIFGIANLLTFMAAIPPYWTSWFSVWKSRLGDPDTEAGRAFLTARSPLSAIDRAFRPILIVQGLEDVRVTRAESEQIVAALTRRRVPVTYVTFRDEGHGFSRPENEIAFRAVTEAFLAKHLGGGAEPIDRARDFKGSTLAVEAGAELVPGLGG
jgi:dipeptidyl aminopeptidase/acylaminoacyl peptidase